MASKSRQCVGIALCGLGRMGMIHIKNILNNNGAHLLYIVEADLAKAKKVVEENKIHEFTKIVHFKNINAALSDERLNAVVIATPTHTHEELVNQAIAAGKHVLCEKPLAVNLKSAMECYKAAREKGLVLLCAFNRRFDPHIQKLIENKHKVGKLLTIKICSRDSPRPSVDYLKISGGIFHDCLVHDLDLGRWITGENPEVVHVLAHCHDPEIAALDDVDTVFTTLKFPSGVLMHVESQRECAFGYDQRIEIYGTKGSLLNTNPRKSSITFNGGQTQDDIHFSFLGRYADAYRNEIDHLIDVIEKKVESACVTAYDTMQATLLSQIAEDSWKENRVMDVKSQSEKILSSYGLSEYIDGIPRNS